MGDFKEHILFGLLTAAVLMYLFEEFIDITALEALSGALAVFIGSIMPDIDHKRSYVHRAVKSFTSISAGILTFLVAPLETHQRYIAGITVFLMVYSFFSRIKMKHRGFTHTLTFCIIATSVGIILSVTFFYTVIPGLALGVGILSHLLMDREFKF